MKVDIVACYYRQMRYASHFFWGVRENAELIHRLIIVNDEEWKDDERTKLRGMAREAGVALTLLDHQHCGYGVARSMNQGIVAADCDYCFLISFDQVMEPECLAKITKLASPQRLVLGSVNGIPESTSVADLPPREWKPDYMLKRIDELRKLRRLWMYARNGHTLVPRATHLEGGGFNEAFCQIGYGGEDMEYGAWWQVAHGWGSIVFGSSNSWHFEDYDSPKQPGKRTQPAAWELIVKPLHEMYGKRYLLFNEELMKVTHVNVHHNAAPSWYLADAELDCLTLDWLLDGSATEIIVRAPNQWLGKADIPAYMQRIASKLAPGSTTKVIA